MVQPTKNTIILILKIVVEALLDNNEMMRYELEGGGLCY